MKPLNKIILTLCLLCSPLVSLGQQTDLSQRVQRLERVVERQNLTLRNLEDRLHRLEYGNTNPFPGQPGYPNDSCSIVYNGSSCKNNPFGYKYSIESDGKPMTECLSSLSRSIDSLKNLKDAGMCNADRPTGSCKLAYNSSACATNPFGYKYSVEINGRTATECLSSQSRALDTIKTLKDAKICY